jgi:hypothetical protein
VSKAAKEGALPPQPVSPTASTRGSEVQYPSGGEQVYRVQVVNGAAITICDVPASTGDEAAEKALVKHPGQKVAHVEPAPQSAQVREAA